MHRFLATGAMIVRRETPLALYKGLGAVLSGIVPKMAIRFASFEKYKAWLADKETGKTSVGNIFIAGLGAGVTEAVLVVTPMEVVKIRLQAQQHSLADPLEAPRYRNAGHAVYAIVREEGVRALYRGVSLTALRQATNQGANFTAYQELKKLAHRWQPDREELPSWQHMVIGLISGAMGPFSNAPIDTIKTRLQKAEAPPGQSAFQRIAAIAGEMWRQEGFRSFYKGITPRVLRVAPGQAVVFAVYERVRSFMETLQGSSEENECWWDEGRKEAVDAQLVYCISPCTTSSIYANFRLYRLVSDTSDWSHPYSATRADEGKESRSGSGSGFKVGICAQAHAQAILQSGTRWTPTAAAAALMHILSREVLHLSELRTHN
ncbi:hypothetical protein ACG7TL_008506 [Trametes sanguinea]